MKEYELSMAEMARRSETSRADKKPIGEVAEGGESCSCSNEAVASDNKKRLYQCIILSGDNSMGVPYVWDYDLDQAQFLDILEGTKTMGRLDSDWAAIRLLDFAPYPDIVHLLGFRRLIEGWPRWREHIRSQSRRRSFDFLTVWLPIHYPELVK